MHRTQGVLRRVWPLALLLLVALLAGCGGGGGGSAAPFTYTTVWGSGVSVQASEFVRLINAGGAVVATIPLNRNGANSSQATLSNVSPGTYEVRAELYALPDAQGTLLGVTEGYVTVGGANARFDTTSAEPLASVTVSPSTATLTEQESKSFLATAISASNRAVFVPSDAIGWSVTGGIGTITSSGEFTATKAGDGAVVATHTSTGRTGTAAVHVNPFQIRQGKWTVLVYMNAANDLAPYSDVNMAQMEQVSSNPDVRFVVQWKQSRLVWPTSTFDGVRRYLVGPGGRQLVQKDLVNNQGNALDMGSPQTLHDFIAWAKTYYPADRYALVIWNHGTGWRERPQAPSIRGFSYDDEYWTYIKTWQIDTALAGQHFDIVAFDACQMQMMEVAYELRSYANYVVGSEENTPADGYPYQTVFAPFRDNPDDTTLNLSKSFADGMLSVPAYSSSRITESVLDTSKMPALLTAIDGLAQALIAERANVTAAVTNIRSASQSYSSSATYLDLWDVCSRLEAYPSIPASVSSAGAAVRAAIGNAVAYEGHNANSPRSHGVSIDFSSSTQFDPYRANYLQLKMAQDSNWDEWLVQAP